MPVHGAVARVEQERRERAGPLAVGGCGVGVSLNGGVTNGVAAALCVPALLGPGHGERTKASQGRWARTDGLVPGLKAFSSDAARWRPCKHGRNTQRRRVSMPSCWQVVAARMGAAYDPVGGRRLHDTPLVHRNIV
jgi:hypothetical protein